MFTANGQVLFVPRMFHTEKEGLLLPQSHLTLASCEHPSRTENERKNSIGGFVRARRDPAEPNHKKVLVPRP